MSTPLDNQLDRFLQIAAANVKVDEAIQTAEQELETLTPFEQEQLFQRMWASTVQAADAIRAVNAAAIAVDTKPSAHSNSLMEVAGALGKLFAGLATRANAELSAVVRPAPAAAHVRMALGASSLPSEHAELHIKFANGIVCRPDMAFPRMEGAKPLGWLLKCPDDGRVFDGQGGTFDARSCAWRLVFRCGDQWIDGPVVGTFDANGEIEVPFSDTAAFTVDLAPVAVEPVTNGVKPA